MNNDLMLAVLSMAAYNPNGNIGKAIQGIQTSDVGTGFGAVAYTYNGQTIISYRGTDSVSDVTHGWTAGDYLGYINAQTKQAADFFWSTAGSSVPFGQPYAANVTFTGHSLGGGLAGMLASLYGKSAVVFDNMGYSTVAHDIYFYATNPLVLDQSTLDTFYHSVTPAAIDASHITGFQESGQVLYTIGQSTGTIVGAGVNWGVWSGAPKGLHSMSLLVLNMYAEQNVTNVAWKGIANVLGPLFLAQNGGTDIAYSVVDEDVRPNGDAAAKLLFDDANDLANVFAPKSKSLVTQGYLDSDLLLKEYCKLMIAYDQSLTKPELRLGVTCIDETADNDNTHLLPNKVYISKQLSLSAA